MGAISWIKEKFGIKNNAGTQIVTSADLYEYLLMGGKNKSLAGEYVTPATAMTVSAVAACVKVLSETIASLPLELFRRIETDGGEGKEKARNEPLYKVLMEKPNSWQTPFEFKEMLMHHLLLAGNAYCLIIRKGLEVVELIPLMPETVTVRQDPDNVLTYTVTRRGGNSTLDFSQNGIFHLRGPSIDGVTGVTPLTWYRETIGGALATQRHSSTFFGKGALPSGVLQHPETIGKDAAKNLLDNFMDMVSGDNKNAVAILEEGMEWKPTTMTNEDSQFLETREFQRSEIAAIYRVPPHKIGDMKRATFSNIEQQERSFAGDSIAPWAVRWEEAVQRDLVPIGKRSSLYAKFILQLLTRGDTKTRGDFYQKMLTSGVFSPNEVREMENRNPREGGDIFYQPLNLGPSNDEAESQNDDNESEAPEPDEATDERK